ncbi:LysR substrate-binding domain-containing protein [Ferrovibrio sp.]|uniref:LysR substrate-binding domain-containing protein n=1 Tax=Ferrovibrio sp. TaxID=1917215 RepID=UPI003515BE4E
MTRLPPFDSLVACEAVLRHGSMTAAAAELGITQSAVSHRLRRLEAFIGTPLLRRLRAGVQPTPAGTALMDGFAEVLDGMAGLRARSRAALAPARLRIGLGAALAQHWLVRRLPAFAARHPGIDIELTVFHTRAQALQQAGDVDLRIQWVKPEEARSSSTRRLLFREQVFPVCAPALLPGGRMLRDPAALAALPLLHKGPDADRRGRGPEAQGQEWEWRSWFRALGIAGRPQPVLRFEEIGTSIAAALEGAGVALGRSLLVHDALADGRLVRPLGPGWQMPSAKVHMALWPAALSGDARLQAFVAWLAAETGKTVAALDTPERPVRRRAG